MNERDFKRLCCEKGFHRVTPKLYARCYGDGLYQTICTGLRKYLDPTSSSYSPQNRKSNYISISICSMYSCIPESIFVEWPTGGCSPDRLHGNVKGTQSEFNGIEEEYEKMFLFGFDALDSIQSQQDYLDFWNRTETGSRGNRFHSLKLAIPFLMVGDEENALFEITHHYTNNTFGFHFHYDPLIAQGAFAEYMDAMRTHNLEMEYVTQLWKVVLGRNDVAAREIIRANFERNLAYVHKYNIPVAANAQFGDIPVIFRRF